MYHEFFGFQAEPFSLTPDSRFLFLSKRHEEALAALVYGVKHRKGFIAITGEVGSGKTILCRTLMVYLDRIGTEIALVLNPDLNDVELLQTVCAEFGLPDQWTSKRALLNTLNQFLLQEASAGHNCVLIIDESQNLPPRTLEQVRMISNLETETEKLIQIVLVGQPELDELLHRPELRQLNQRITVRYHLEPLDAEEIGQYVAHRIKVAKPKEPVVFTDAAIQRLAEETGGVPRRINVVCDRALLVGYVDETRTLDLRHIEKAIKEVTGTRPKHPVGTGTAPAPAAPEAPESPAGSPRMTEALTQRDEGIPSPIEWPVTEAASTGEPATVERAAVAPGPGSAGIAPPEEEKKPRVEVGPPSEPPKAEPESAPAPPAVTAPVPTPAAPPPVSTPPAPKPPASEPAAVPVASSPEPAAETAGLSTPELQEEEPPVYTDELPPPAEHFRHLAGTAPTEEAWSSIPVAKARVPDTLEAAGVAADSTAPGGIAPSPGEPVAGEPAATAPSRRRSAARRGVKILVGLALVCVAAYLGIWVAPRYWYLLRSQSKDNQSKINTSHGGSGTLPEGPMDRTGKPGETGPGSARVLGPSAGIPPPIVVTPSPTPTLTPSPTASPAKSAAPPPLPTKPSPAGKIRTPTSKPSATAPPSPSATPRPTASPAASPSPAPSPSPSASESPSPSASPPPSPSASATASRTASPPPSATPGPSSTASESAPPSPSVTSRPRWSVDSSGVVRVDRADLTEVGSLLTWLNLIGKPVDMTPLRSQPPEVTAHLQLATGRAPLWLRKSPLPRDLGKLAKWRRPCIIQYGNPAKNGSGWVVLRRIQSGQAQLLDPLHGAISVPEDALQSALLEVYGLYMDPDNLAAARPGEEGARVKKIRALLHSRGFQTSDQGTPDISIYDRALSESIAGFQRQQGLPGKGIMDAPTAWLLLAPKW